MVRKLLSACLVALIFTGCVTQIRRVPATRDHASEPNCTTSYGWVAGDTALAAITSGTALIFAERTSDRTQSQGAAVVGLGFSIAAGSVPAG